MFITTAVYHHNRSTTVYQHADVQWSALPSNMWCSITNMFCAVRTSIGSCTHRKYNTCCCSPNTGTTTGDNKCNAICDWSTSSRSTTSQHTKTITTATPKVNATNLITTTVADKSTAATNTAASVTNTASTRWHR